MWSSYLWCVDSEWRSFSSSFTTCDGNQYQCSLWFLFQMFLFNFLNETYVHYWELMVPLFLVVMFHWTLILEILHRGLIPKVLRVGYLPELFSSVLLSLFFQANHNNNKKSLHNLPIMTKMTSSATISYVTPVKATPGKLVIKNKLSSIGELENSPGHHRINQVRRPCRQQQQWHRCRSQSTKTTSSRQSDSSNLVRTLDFVHLPDHTKKEPYLIDFCNPVDVESECLIYLSDARDLPLSQESRLTFLLNNLKFKYIQMAFIELITIVGGAATTAFLPMPSTKVKLVKDFPCLIYDHKSMMINTDETSYR